MYPIVGRLLVLALVRGVAAGAFVAAAIAIGAEARPALLAFALGTASSALLLLSDRRSRFRREPVVEPLPQAAPRARWAHAVAGGLWPSTLGVAVFTAAALAADTTLAALLAGILGGMAVASVISAVRIRASEGSKGARFYGELGGRRVFSAPR